VNVKRVFWVILPTLSIFVGERDIEFPECPHCTLFKYILPFMEGLLRLEAVLTARKVKISKECYIQSGLFRIFNCVIPSLALLSVMSGKVDCVAYLLWLFSWFLKKVSPSLGLSVSFPGESSRNSKILFSYITSCNIILSRHSWFRLKFSISQRIPDFRNWW